MGGRASLRRGSIPGREERDMPRFVEPFPFGANVVNKPKKGGGGKKGKGKGGKRRRGKSGS
jgi:hypothetical protein